MIQVTVPIQYLLIAQFIESAFQDKILMSRSRY